MNKVFKKIIFLIFILQLVISPALAYTFFNEENLGIDGFDFFMRIDPLQYYSLVLPSLFFFGLGFFKKFRFYRLKSEDFNKVFNDLRNSHKNYKIAKIFFCFISFCIVVKSLGILFVTGFSSRLLDSLVLTNCFYFLFSKGKFRIHFFILLLLYFINQTISLGMFGNLFFTIVIFLIYYGFANKYGFIKSLQSLILILILLITFQGLKSTYRAEIDSGNNTLNPNISTFTNLLVEQSSNFNLIFTKESIFFLNLRLNQGLYVSHVMEHVPDFQEYTYGTNLFNGIIAALVPRFIWPNKPKSGGVYNISTYANLDYDGKTSINISPIGEAYIVGGSFIAPIIMFLYGLLLNFILSKIENKITKHNNIILWMPIFILPLFQGVEEDISSILNYYVKFMLVFLFIFYSVKLIFNSK